MNAVGQRGADAVATQQEAAGRRAPGCRPPAPSMRTCCTTPAAPCSTSRNCAGASRRRSVRAVSVSSASRTPSAQQQQRMVGRIERACSVAPGPHSVRRGGRSPRCRLQIAPGGKTSQSPGRNVACARRSASSSGRSSSGTAPKSLMRHHLHGDRRLRRHRGGTEGRGRGEAACASQGSRLQHSSSAAAAGRGLPAGAGRCRSVIPGLRHTRASGPFCIQMTGGSPDRFALPAPGREDSVAS